MSTNDTRLSVELLSRPDDEHFASMSDFLASAKDSKDNSKEFTIDTKQLVFVSNNGNLGIKVGDNLYFPSRFALERINKVIRFGFDVAERLRPNTLVNLLNELWEDRNTMKDKTKILVQGNKLRDIREQSYSPVWDYDYYSLINEFMPNGMTPALPTINSDGKGLNVKGNRKPALFRGDRDSTCFFHTDKDNGGNANLGGLRQGFLCWNSEVFNRSIGHRKFLFRDMCANFIIWDRGEVVEHIAYHTGSDEKMYEFFAKTKRILMHIDNEINQEDTQVLEMLMKVPFVGSGKKTEENKDKSVNKLREIFKQRITKKQAETVIDATSLPQNMAQMGDPDLSFWTVANGITWTAKESVFGSSVEDGGRMAGELLSVGEDFLSDMITKG